MCRPVTCKVCRKTTWAGCGQHVEEVMAGIPRADRCPTHSDAEKNAAKNAAGQATSVGSFFGRLFGR